MEFKQAFENYMETASDIALATAVDGKPNVRIVNFIWCSSCKTLYFTTFLDTGKIAELEKNSNVSFTTVPVKGVSFVRVLNATAKRSQKTVAEMQETFVKKYPGFEGLFSMGLDKFALYEVHFTEAGVSRDFGDYGTVTL